jgi:hypothetical protein
MAGNTSRNWVCPFCNRAQTLTHGQEFEGEYYINLAEHKFGEAGLFVQARACANKDCGEIALTVALTQGEATRDQFGSDYTSHDVIKAYKLRPETAAKPQPDYIPQAIRDDYYEACRIRDLSPKSSATLARRCLQGMIRDFSGIAKGRLIDELDELSHGVNAGNAPAGVTPEAVDAIDHVRSIGNIGAHMEKDVNVLVDIDPGEVQVLIELLFEEWYVARESRRQRLAKVTAIGAQKAQQLTTARAQAASAKQGKLAAPVAASVLAPPIATSSSGDP